LQSGAALDAEISLYVTRLSHTNALTKLVQLISEGGIDAKDLMEVNDGSGQVVDGRLNFHSASHMLSFKPRNPLSPNTLYTITLKQNLMHVKKEIADLTHGSRKTKMPLRSLITEPEYSFTFTTTDRPWRKLVIHRRHASEPFPAVVPAVAWTVVLKNADEVLEGLQVLIADALGVDEDEDISTMHTMVGERGSLQYARVTHGHVATLADGDSILVTTKATAQIVPPAKKQRVESSQSTASCEGGSSSGPPPARSAKERLAELKDLFESDLISQQDFESKKKAILDGI